MASVTDPDQAPPLGPPTIMMEEPGNEDEDPDALIFTGTSMFNYLAIFGPDPVTTTSTDPKPVEYEPIPQVIELSVPGMGCAPALHKNGIIVSSTVIWPIDLVCQ
jgi:hypothetical protein